MTHPTVFISRDPHYDFLSALEFGRVADGQHRGCWRPVDERFAYFVPRRKRHPRGFHIQQLDEFDPFAPEVEAIWNPPRFRAPLLGLESATAGEIVVAALAHLGDEPTVNRVYFGSATHKTGEEALGLWRCCLEAGDCMAHFAIGYTLLELGRDREAYAHLRHYTELAPYGPWNWCWFGRAAAAIGERAEAERAFRRALELTARGGPPTDAAERLSQLRGGGASDEDIPF